MVFFPEKYTRPVLVDIVKAAEMGWNAVCSNGTGAASGGDACIDGQSAGNSSCIALTSNGLFQNGNEGSSSSRLINPGDVSQGL